MIKKLSLEDRKQAALDCIEEGSYLVYRGETYRIDTWEIEDGNVLISDPNTGAQSMLAVEDFLTDDSAAVLGLFPIFDNREENPTLSVAIYTQQQLDRLYATGAEIMDIITESLQ